MSCNLWKTPVDTCERMRVKKAKDILVVIMKIVWTFKGTPVTSDHTL